MIYRAEELPDGLVLHIRHVLDFSPLPKLEPNLAMLKVIKRTNSKQSKISKQRQNFIMGMERYRMPNEERKGRADYMHNWEHRLQENEW